MVKLYLRVTFRSKIALAAAGACIFGVTVAAAAPVNPEHDPFAASADRLAARFAAVDREIARLQAIGDAAGASAMSARLQHYEDEFAGLAPSDLSGPALDVVSIYEGALGSNGDPPPTSSGTIHVQATDRPIVLTIGAYSPMEWTLDLDPGVKLEKVLLFGHYSQSIIGVPSNVPLEQAAGFIGYGADLTYYQHTARDLYTSTGLPVSSVQGAYVYPNQPFVVGAGSVEWRAQHVLREMAPLYADATAFDRKQQADAAATFHATGLYRTYDGNPGNLLVNGPTSVAITTLNPFGPAGAADSITPSEQSLFNRRRSSRTDLLRRRWTVSLPHRPGHGRSDDLTCRRSRHSRSLVADRRHVRHPAQPSHPRQPWRRRLFLRLLTGIPTMVRSDQPSEQGHPGPRLPRLRGSHLCRARPAGRGPGPLSASLRCEWQFPWGSTAF